jgi:hypothetical protein
VIPVAFFARVGIGGRVRFPVLPQIERKPLVVWDGRIEQSPATVLTWGPFRVVLVWPAVLPRSLRCSKCGATYDRHPRTGDVHHGGACVLCATPLESMAPRMERVGR